jgi:hypothetical protein
MSISPEESVNNPDHFPSEAIQRAALSHGIVLATDRLTNLSSTFDTNKLHHAIGGRADRIVDPQNDFIVTNDIPTPDGGTQGSSWWSGNGSVAEVHFVPDPVRINDRLVIHEAHPERASQYGHQIIQGLQNYFLLVEAGCMEPRDLLTTEATTHVAKVAKHLFGFEGFETGVGENGQPWERIAAPFDLVRDHVFSERVHRFDHALSARLSDTQ